MKAEIFITLEISITDYFIFIALYLCYLELKVRKAVISNVNPVNISRRILCILAANAK